MTSTLFFYWKLGFRFYGESLKYQKQTEAFFAANKNNEQALKQFADKEIGVWGFELSLPQEEVSKWDSRIKIKRALQEILPDIPYHIFQMIVTYHT